MQEFISEDDLKTFEGWLKYQAVDPATTPQELLAELRSAYDKSMERLASTPKVGRIKLQPIPGEYRYAVAVQDGPDLWLTLWVRRSRKDEFFIMLPHGDRDWDAHASYHLDGTLHIKTHGRKLHAQKRQPLTGTFRGAEHLGAYAGAGVKGVGAVCHPEDFHGVVVVPQGVLGPRDGWIAVDLVEPGQENHVMEFPGQRIEAQEIFRESAPWIVITVRSA